MEWSPDGDSAQMRPHDAFVCRRQRRWNRLLAMGTLRSIAYIGEMPRLKRKQRRTNSPLSVHSLAFSIMTATPHGSIMALKRYLGDRADDPKVRTQAGVWNIGCWPPRTSAPSSYRHRDTNHCQFPHLELNFVLANSVERLQMLAIWIGIVDGVWVPKVK